MTQITLANDSQLTVAVAQHYVEGVDPSIEFGFAETRNVDWTFGTHRIESIVVLFLLTQFKKTCGRNNLRSVWSARVVSVMRKAWK